jgi:hypothetical protein
MSNSLRRACTALFALVVLTSAAHANAAPITYFGSDSGAGSTDPRPLSDAAAATFAAAAGSSTLVTFESSPLGAFSDLSIAAGVSIDGTDDIGADQTIRNTAYALPDELYGYNTTAGGSQFVSLYGGNLVFTFTNPITAFGAYFAGHQSPTFGALTLTFNDGSPQTVQFPAIGSNGGVSFIGFTNATPFTSLTVNAFSDIISVDDVRFSSAAVTPVPEPATLTLVGAGLLAGARRWRKSRRQA